MKKRIALYLTLIVIAASILRVDTVAKTSNVYNKINSNDKMIALTFDDGPHPRITKKILSILNEYGVTATFFVIGQNVVNYPEAMKLIVDSGCEIGNHTYSHQNFRKMSQGEMSQEFEACKEILDNDFSVKPRLIRPPEGFCSDKVHSACEKMNCDIILWSIDTRDWAHTPSDEIVRNVLENASSGDIILMHDYVSGKDTTADALRIIIPTLLERGFRFVTVSELIEAQV